MNSYIHFKIPGNPKGKGRPRFGQGRTYTPQGTADYEDFVRVCFFSQVKGSKGFAPDIALSVKIKAVFGIPKSFSKAKRAAALSGDILPTKKPDCDNIIKIILDALNGVAYADDKQVVNVSCEKVYGETASVFVEIMNVSMNFPQIEKDLKDGKLFKCDPEKNTGCTKESCFIYGGDCMYTTNKNYARG